MDLPSELGDLFNRVGVEAVRVLRDEDAKVLIYAEIDASGENIIFLAAKRGENRFRSPGDVTGVADALREAWNFSRSLGAQHRWNGVAYKIDHRRMTVDLLYGDEVDINEDPFEKQDRLVEKYFPGMKVED